jgi:hypothetical protein
MKNSILNLEGVQVLSRNEKKNVNGGLAEGGRNCVKTGVEKDLYGFDTYTNTYIVVSHVCEWKCKTKFLGITTGSETHFGGCGVWG